MVKRSKKSKSKRTPLRQKYKILRKVKEHHKKAAKEAKKAQKAGKVVRREKDPGIPNSWPLKEQELQALEARRAHAIQEKELAREAKKAAREAARAGGKEAGAAEGESAQLQRLVGEAGERGQEFLWRAETEEARAEQQDRKRKDVEDGSRRAFYREVQKVVEAADVVIQVLDARDPLGCRCPELESLVLRGKAGGPKRLILLLNKIDLVPREAVEKWLRYLREELPTVAFKCSVQAQKQRLGRVAKGKGRTYGGLSLAPAGAGKDGAAAEDSSTSKCLGADTLIQLLKNYCRNKDIKTAITVGIVGLPNVGKSSLINSLKRARVANVGSTPGVTRSLQEVHLDKHVKLLDCPGVVMTSSSSDDLAAAALRNAIRVEQLSDPMVPVRRIVQLCSKDALMSAYKIARFADVDEFVRSVAFARGRLKKGGVPDMTTAARLILNDWNDGRIPFYTSPPKRATMEAAGLAGEEGAQVVQEWGREFDADSVFQEERSAVIEGLAGIAERPEGVFAVLPAGAPVQMEAEAAGEGEGAGEQAEEEDEGSDADGDTGDAAAEEMETDGADIPVTPRKAKGSAEASKGSQQNETLYTADGIKNPHAARAEKKRRKREKKGKVPKDIPMTAAKAGAAKEGDDYNFDEGFME